MDFYFAYYFPVNVAKIQINLLQFLRRERRFPEELSVVEIGVGSGTTIAAIADFLLAWDTAAKIHGVYLPMRSLSYVGIDRSDKALKIASQMAQALEEIIDTQYETLDDARYIIDGLQKASWQTGDALKDNLDGIFTTGNLMVLSYVINEINNDADRLSLASKALLMPNNGILLLLEPGDERNSKFLMALREQLLITFPGKFASTGPCSSVFSSDQKRQACKTCWNARQHTLAEPTLYRAVRKAFHLKRMDRRRFDEFENTLLSWSYTWLVRGTPLLTSESTNHQLQPNAKESPWPNDARLLYRRPVQRKDKVYQFVTEQGPDGQNFENEELLFCFSHGKEEPIKARLERPIGYILPKLNHGDEVFIQGAKFTQTRTGQVVLKVNSDTKINHVISTERQTPSIEPLENALNLLAYRYFGFPSLRPFQLKLIKRVLSGKSVLAIAATGSGKSECFILPAMISPGITIVVSPLVSLMADQYEQRIKERYGLDYLSTIFNGDLPLNEKNARLRRLELGYYKLAYFTPEQLERDYILDALHRANDSVGITYLAADEAHCIAQWGHDFRPAYLNLYKRLKHRGIDPIRIALTATASPNVRKDICEELCLDLRSIDDGGDVYLESSNRPELNLIVRALPNTAQKADDIVHRLKQLHRQNKKNSRPGAAIVFAPHTGGNPNNINYEALCSNPNGGKYSAGVAQFASYLERCLGKSLSIYHSKMDMEETQLIEGSANSDNNPPAIGDLSNRTRRKEQHAFIEGDTDVMVATKGFGMGIDKANIRLVLHRSPPANLEAYAQEAGRAGRDGELADVVLYYSPDNPPNDNSASQKTKSDHEIQSYFLNEKYIRREDIELLHAWITQAKATTFGSYYLTSHEFIEFVKCANENPGRFGLTSFFSWPKFEPYPNPLRAFGEHLEILTRGHWFNCVSDYINRILQSLYRIHPEIARKRYAFLTRADQCGIQFNWPYSNSTRIKAEQVINSNLFFGERFRAPPVPI